MYEPEQELMEQYHQESQLSGLNPKNNQMVSSITSQHPTVVHEQLENEHLIRNIEMRLKGLRYNILTKQLEPTGYPLIADNEGVEKVIAIIQSHLDKVYNISVMTDEEIYKHMLDLYTEVTLFVYFEGYHKYKIKKGDLSLVVRIICTPVFANLKRARDGIQLQNIAAMQKLIQSVGDSEPKRGWLSRLGLKI